MNQAKRTSAMTMANLQLNPAEPVAVLAESNRRSRHAAITHDLYSYQRYKHWMNKLRSTLEKT